MLKKILLTLCALTLILDISKAQDSLMYGIFPAKNDKILYTRDLAVKNLNKSERLSKVKEWASKEYNKQMDTINASDGGQDLISFQAFTIVLFNEPATNVSLEWQCWQNIQISFTNDSATIIITDLELKAPSGYGTVTTTRIENMKKKLDSLPSSSFFGKNNKERYWQTQLTTFKEIDKKVKGAIESFEKAIAFKKTGL